MKLYADPKTLTYLFLCDTPDHCTYMNNSIFYHVFSDYYVWQWEDEKGKWNPYDAQVSADLENAKDSGKTISIVAAHRSYDLDLSKMEQINTVTNVARKFERCKSGETNRIFSSK